MANLPNPALLTANGDFDITTLIPGDVYLFLLKGTFGGATVTLTFLNPVTGDWSSIEGGAITGEFEDQLTAPSKSLRFTVSGATGTTAVSVNLIPIEK